MPRPCEERGTWRSQRGLWGLWRSQEGFKGSVTIPGWVYRARGKGLGIGDRCSMGQCPPRPDPVGLGVRGLEAQGRGCPGFFIYFYFLLFISLPSCSSACIRRTDFPSQELSRLFSFIRGLRDGGEHRKHWGGSQDAPMASPFTLTPQSGVWTSKPFGFGQILQKNISWLSASL